MSDERDDCPSVPSLGDAGGAGEVGLFARGAKARVTATDGLKGQ